MDIVVITKPIQISEVAQMASDQFGNLIKATVDIQKKIMALGGELHADEEQLLLDKGSKQADLWGINVYPAKYSNKEFIEFDSMINIRPSQGNMSREVEDPAIKKQIKQIVGMLVVDGN